MAVLFSPRQRRSSEAGQGNEGEEGQAGEEGEQPQRETPPSSLERMSRRLETQGTTCRACVVYVLDICRYGLCGYRKPACLQTYFLAFPSCSSTAWLAPLEEATGFTRLQLALGFLALCTVLGLVFLGPYRLGSVGDKE